MTVYAQCPLLRKLRSVRKLRDFEHHFFDTFVSCARTPICESLHFFATHFHFFCLLKLLPKKKKGKESIWVIFPEV